MGKLYLVVNPLAVYLLDEKGESVSYHRLLGDTSQSEEVAEMLYEFEQGKLPDKILEFISRNVKAGDELIVEDNDLARFLSQNLKGVTVEVKTADIVFSKVRENITTLIEKTVGVSPQDYYDALHKVALTLSRMKVRETAEKRDLFVAQAIDALDDINKTINLFASRVREWYSLHFPELDELVDDHEDYFKIVSNIGSRENMTLDKLVKLGIKEDVSKKIVEAAEKSMGADITEFDLEAIRLISDAGLRLYAIRRSLEKYIDEAMYEVAPNIRGIVGSLLGARLIALAGGLEKLAKMPASTIQVLGAEKALFRALRFGAKPPKHGVIFQHPLIHKSPKWQRGKIARALAAKLAIAARIDAFTGEYRADELKEELEKRVEEIKTLYAKPPVKVEKTEKPRKHVKRKKGGAR